MRDRLERRIGDKYFVYATAERAGAVIVDNGRLKPIGDGKVFSE